ncbi:unnamed protein product [Ectocarpus sp. 8 AP-2014]
MPSVEGGVGDELPSGDVSATAPGVKVEGGDTSLTAGLAAGGVTAMGAIGAAVGLSGDKPNAEVSSGDVDASVLVPGVPSVYVAKPKKGLFGGLFGSSKAKIEVPGAADESVPGVAGSLTVPDVSGDVFEPNVSGAVSVPDVVGSLRVPDVSGDVFVPNVSGAVSVPGVAGSLTVPDVSGDVFVPNVSGAVDVPSVDIDAPSVSVEVRSMLPSGDVSVTAPGVKVEGGDTSLTAGLAAGGVAAMGAIGAAVGLSGDKPDAELLSGDVNASVSVPDGSVDVKKPKKGLFGGLSFKELSLKGKAKGKNEEAEPLFERSLAIFESSLGPDHPDVATALHDRAKLLMIQDKYTEAVPPLERALSIRTKKLGGNHRDTVNTRAVLERVREKVSRPSSTKPFAIAVNGTR